MTRGGKRRGAGRPAGTGTARRLVAARIPVAVHQAMVETQVTGESVTEYVTAAVAAEAQRRRAEEG